MPSLTQLLSAHRNLLVLDAASTKIQVGLLRPDVPALWRETQQDSGTGFFPCVETVLHDSSQSVGSIDAFIFCSGPGSMLGIRTVAMALRTWQSLQFRPAYAYASLALAGIHEWKNKTHRAFAVVTDARRETWHVQVVEADGRRPELQRPAPGELPEGELITPENFRAWAQFPRLAGVCSYDLSKLFSALETEDLFHEVKLPDAFQHEAPTYKKWSAQIHRPTPAAAK